MFYQLPEAPTDYVALLPIPASPKRPRRRRARRAKKQRVVNYAGRNTKATQALHDRISAMLADSLGMTVRDIASELGISRQLCLYHIKKMVAHGRILAELHACPKNGGVQFVCFEKTMRALELAIWLKATTGLAA